MPTLSARTPRTVPMVPMVLALLCAFPAAAATPAAATPASASPPTASASSEAPSTPATARVGWGCIKAPAATLARARASAFGAWARDVRVPAGTAADASAAGVACVDCTMGLETAPACAWRDKQGPAAAAPGRASACPDPGSSEVYGTVDLATLLQGLSVQAPPSSSLPQIARRLGLTDMEQLCFSGRMRSPKTWAADAWLRAKAAPYGLLATLGPPVTPQLPWDIGTMAAQSVSVSVIPARVWNLLETLVAGAMPLQYTLLRVQLDTLERAQATRWADDILGSRPAVWTLYQDRKGGLVGLIEGADGARAVTFLAAAIESLADMLPGLQFSVFKKAVTMATLTVPARAGGPPAVLHLAFFPKRIVVATSLAALSPHLKKRDTKGGGPILRAAAAAAFGTIDTGTGAAAWSSIPEAIRPPLIKNARGVWFFSPEAQGWRGSVEMTVERQTFGQ